MPPPPPCPLVVLEEKAANLVPHDVAVTLPRRPKTVSFLRYLIESESDGKYGDIQM